MSASAPQEKDPVAPATPDISTRPWWRCGREWVRPPSSPPPRYFTDTSDELLAQLGTPEAVVVEELLTEANAAYQEAGERAEGAERRATTIQGSIAIAASLTLAGGSLLLDSTGTPSHPWEIAISAGFALTVLLLAIAAWRAFLVTWPRFLWASPAVTDITWHAAMPSADAIKLQRTSDLLVAYGRNDSVARLKLVLLGQAVRWLISALVVLSIVAIMLAAYAIVGSPAHSAPSGGRACRSRTCMYRAGQGHGGGAAAASWAARRPGVPRAHPGSWHEGRPAIGRHPGLNSGGTLDGARVTVDLQAPRGKTSVGDGQEAAAPRHLLRAQSERVTGHRSRSCKGRAPIVSGTRSRAPSIRRAPGARLALTPRHRLAAHD